MATSNISEKNDSYCSVAFNAVINTESKCEYVWLDETIKNNQFILEKLRNLDEDIKFFDTLTECEKFIKEVTEVNIVLIVTLNYCRQIVQNIHDLHHLQVINVYDNEGKDERIWTTDFPKIYFFISINNLIEKCFISPKLVTDDYESALFRLQSIDKTASSTKKNDILWLPSFLLTLDRIDKNPNGKSEFVKTCRTIYKNKKANLKLLDDFDQTYTSDTVISWYTKPCFLFKLLNKVLREQNVEGILLFHFFIKDLNKKIELQFYKGTTTEMSWERDKGFAEGFAKKIIRENDNYLPVDRIYRGQIMTKHELETLKSDAKELLYFNSFLSTTEHRDLALIFAGARSYCLTSEYQSVVFEIDVKIKNDRHPKPYAKIDEFSEMENENEILFTLGSIFNITDITFDETESSWFIKMEPASELIEQIPLIFSWSRLKPKHRLVDYRAEWELLKVGSLLEFRPNINEKPFSDIKLYYLLLRKYIPDSFGIAAAYMGIGILKFNQHCFTRCIKYLQKAFKIYTRTIPAEIFYYVEKCNVKIQESLRYYRTILCEIYEYIIIACLFLRNNVEEMNKRCVQLAKTGCDELECDVNCYISIVRQLKTLGYYESVSKLCASLKMYERIITGCGAQNFIVAGNGWNIMEAIMHIDINDLDFYTKMKHNEQYFEYLWTSDCCKNGIQRIFHGTIIVCKYIADLYRKKRRMDLALPWYEMIIANIEEEYIAMYYSFIAEGFIESNEKQRALAYYGKAVDHWREIQYGKRQSISLFDLDDASLMLFDFKQVVDEVIRLPQYPRLCEIRYGVLREYECDDIIDFHQNAYNCNDLLTEKREWLSILGTDYCAHTSRIHADMQNFDMAVEWCRKAFQLWPQQYRYRLITSKIEIRPSLARYKLILLVQQLCKKIFQSLECGMCE